jgi:septal ring factor EnvC (AmiA/AmiB activator)
MNEEQLERLFTKLGEMHSDIQSLKTKQTEGHDERAKLRDDLDTLQRTVSRAIGLGLGAWAVAVACISLFT